jgi:hypothetical protein
MKKFYILLATLAVLASTGFASVHNNDDTYLPGSTLTVNPAAKLNGLLRRTNLGTPVLAATNAVVTSTNMKVGAYTIAAQPDIARNITVTQTAVGTTDTSGTVLVTGTDIAGNVITETLTPVAGSTVAGAKAFKTVTSIVGTGWVLNPASTSTADTIVFGTGNLIGLPFTFTDATGSALTILGTTVAASPTTGNSVLATSTVDASAGTYNGTKILYIYADH